MKRTFKVPFLATVHKAYKASAFALGAVVLFGCPIYSGNQADFVCDSQGNCCDENSGNCQVLTCDWTSQCPGGSTCQGGLCVSGTYDGGGYYDYDAGSEAGEGDAGSDATVNDCSTQGCPTGQTCTLSNGSAVCVPNGDATVGSGDGGTPEAGPPADAGTDAFSFPPFTGCQNDLACADAGVGARCLDGVCTAAANECFDSTQCQTVGGAAEDCVQGVCTPTCAGATQCPSGYACDTSTSVCTKNPTPCGEADGGAASCGSGLTCVDEHCVPFCTPKVAQGGTTFTCTGSGMVCVDNGCIPDQAPQFICNTEGVQDNCKTGSICLHHSCYIACSTSDAGDAGNSCKTADQFNECKAVTTNTGTYDVCGSNTNLGNQCNPTDNLNCSSPAICIDGYCR
jgi:hypothetical protein